jgi:stage V sporulation protein D (sporulation-specific penicillin-binding protein)
MSWRENKLNRSRARSEKQGRIKFLAVFFIVCACIIVLRLFDLQVLRGGFYATLAVGQHELYQKLFPERGSIYVVESDGNAQTLFPLVTNRELHMLYAVPKDIEEPEETAQRLFDFFGLPDDIDMEKVEEELFADISEDLDPELAKEIKDARRDTWLEERSQEEVESLEALLSKENDPYEPIQHKLTDEEMETIMSWEVEGLAFKEEVWRFYPEQGIGGHIFGFWGFDGNTRSGKYGIEGYFNKELSGRFGEIQSERDAWGNLIAIGNHSLREKVDGSDVVLTLDRAIQYKACQSLYAAVERFEAEGGSIVVLNPKTGGILAMCGAPDYSPDEYNKVESIGVYNNPALFNAYEPGSIFKPLTMAIALDTGKVEPGTTYEDTGSVYIRPHTIKNFEDAVFGKQTMTEVLEKSINTGVIYAMRQTTPKVFAQYVKDFGFGQFTGMKLDGESLGNITNLDKRGEIYAATASFGQGISVTPVQMVAAMGSIANDGKLMQPYLVSQIINSDGAMETYYPTEVRQVISSKAATMLSGMMVSVVENGHGKAAKVKGYRLAGKTGTAQMASKTSRGYSSDVSTSFIGFGPFADPKFVMLVRVDRPSWGKTGAAVAAPVFADVAKFILQYYNVPHDAIE